MKVWGCELCRVQGKKFEVNRTLTGYSKLAEHYRTDHPGQVVQYGCKAL